MIARRRRTNSDSEKETNKENQRPNGSLYSDAPLIPLRKDPEMTCRDRTNEFLSAVKSFSSRQVWLFLDLMMHPLFLIYISLL